MHILSHPKHIQFATTALSQGFNMIADANYFETNVSQSCVIAVYDAFEKFEETRSILFFAQMQSGKTNAFLLLASEMLRLKKVNHVVIFTGNRELELQRQCKNDMEEFYEYEGKYENYLINYADMDPDNIDYREIDRIKNAITILWGTQLRKNRNNVPRQNTLYICEESHFAQTVGQCPDKFLKHIGLPMNGNTDSLETNHNYVCSVSATPFSETCDIGNFKQPKAIVRIRPGQGYRGIHWLKENNKIVGFDNWTTQLEEALQENAGKNKWSFVRVRGKEQNDLAKRLAISNNYDIVVYDQTFEGELPRMKDLVQNPPSKDTVVLLRELCRMGTVIPKNHISFMLETAKNSKTDTLLQSLLGRACGYHENDDLVVYLNNELVESGEIERFLQFCEGEENTVPENAKNVVPSKKIRKRKIDGQSFVYTIPICIPKKFISVDFDEFEASIRDIRNALDEPEVINQNTDAVTQKLLQEFDNAMQRDAVGRIITRRRMSKNTFQNVPGKLTHAMQMREGPVFGNGGCGVTGEQRIVLYYVDKPTHGMELGSYYLCYFVELTEEEEKAQASLIRPRLPGTTGREIFRYANLENNELIPVPEDMIGFAIKVNPDALKNAELMYQTLRECVKQSTNANASTVLSIPRYISSFGNSHGAMYLSLEVYGSMLYGGNIYNSLNDEFGVMIKMEKKRGKVPASVDLECPVGVVKISW